MKTSAAIFKSLITWLIFILFLGISVSPAFAQRIEEQGAPESSAKKSKTQENNYLIVRGLIDLNKKSVTFLPFGLLETNKVIPLPAEGPYRLELLDEKGTVEYFVRFSPQIGSASSHNLCGTPYSSASSQDLCGTPDSSATIEIGSFIIPVPYSAAIKEARVLSDGQSMGNIVSSENAPTIKVTFPRGYEVISEKIIHVEWESYDPDGDPLSHTVQYSADGGKSWTTIAVDSTKQTLAVDSSFLAGSKNALIRVFVTDGFHVASDTSGPFSTANNPPSIDIQSPDHGSLFAGNQTIFFRASAFDTEDGVLGGESIRWKSNLDGFFGNGTEVVLSADSLSSGLHSITASVTDSVGATAEKSVSITIENDSERTQSPRAQLSSSNDSSQPATIVPIRISRGEERVRFRITGESLVSTVKSPSGREFSKDSQEPGLQYSKVKSLESYVLPFEDGDWQILVDSPGPFQVNVSIFEPGYWQVMNFFLQKWPDEIDLAEQQEKFIIVSAGINFGGWVVGANISVVVDRPDGSQVEIHLSDTRLGTYVYEFKQFSGDGLYKFTATANVSDARVYQGEFLPRGAPQYVPAPRGRMTDIGQVTIINAPKDKDSFDAGAGPPELSSGALP